MSAFLVLKSIYPGDPDIRVAVDRIITYQKTSTFATIILDSPDGPLSVDHTVEELDKALRELLYTIKIPEDKNVYT